MSNLIDHPSHYAEATHGIPGECITYTEHLGFVRGNAFKYVWRSGFKDSPAQDLHKALWYIRRDITHGGSTNPDDRPGHLSYALSSGPMTLRRRILINIWSRRDLTATADLLHIAINSTQQTLDEEI